MFELTENTRVYLFGQPCDMRKGFYKLAALAQEHCKKEVRSDSSLYVFISRRKDRVKLLYWHNDGYCLWYKRLEVGTFRIDEREGVNEITGVDLSLLLSGMSLKRILFRKQNSAILAA